MALKTLLSLLLLGCGDEPEPEPEVHPMVLSGTFAFQQKTKEGWSPWDRVESVEPDRLRLWVQAESDPEDAWVYVVVSTQDQTARLVARRTPDQSGEPLLAEGFPLARQGEPWRLVQIVASDRAVPGLEDAASGDVECAYQAKADLFGTSPCEALQGIRGVGKPRVRSPTGNKNRYRKEIVAFGETRLPGWTMTHEGDGAVSVDLIIGAR